MRKGTNPAKLENSKVENPCFHQVIVPVYLPKLEGYYKDGLDILKLCLESIYLTVHDKTFISVVNNGSCDEVKSYLDDMLKDAKINEVIHTSSIGKINAIAKGLSGHNFDLVTITDADVLFTKGWQKAVYDIYKAFPKAGMVCTTPQSKRLKYLTECIFFDNFFNSKLKFRPVKNPVAMQKFAESIDNKNLLKQIHLDKILSIKNNETIAVLGAGHFSATYKKQLLAKLKKSHTEDKISKESDKQMLDLPSISKGHWRLSTYENFTYHLGNSIQSWMVEKLKSIRKQNKEIECNFKESISSSKTSVALKQLLIRKLLFRNKIWKHYLKRLGLNKDEANNY